MTAVAHHRANHRKASRHGRGTETHTVITVLTNGIEQVNHSSQRQLHFLPFSLLGQFLNARKVAGLD
jgi:hypothetical protein